MKLKTAVVLLAVIIFSTVGCVSTESKSKSQIEVSSVNYRAKTFVYSISSAPNLFVREFVSKVTINRKGEVKSYRFDNKISGSSGGGSDNIVLLAISSSAAGVGIYDTQNRPIIEYPKGIFSGKVALFSKSGTSGKQYLRWMFGDKSILSVIESFDSKGILQYSEITIYNPIKN
ncbi:MAG: hypothetical protein ACN4E2_06970 [Nitrospinota bacterium]